MSGIMAENLVVSTWIGVRKGCSVTYCLNGSDDVDLMLSDNVRRFEFAIESEALQQLVEVGAKALAEIETMADLESTGLGSQASGELGPAAGRSA